MDVHELIKDSRIWAGINKPSLPIKDADIVVFSVPFDGGVSFRSGAKHAPQAIRDITYTIDPTTEFFESYAQRSVLDLGDAHGANRDEIFRNAEAFAFDAVRAGKFFTMIGGDHSVTIPVQSGIDRALDESFGIIHIDAHFDLYDDMDGDKLSHGSTQRRALALKNISGIENLFFVGIRNIGMSELEFYYDNNVNVLTAASVNAKGVDASLRIIKEKMASFKSIYVTVDIDCLDPAYAAGTGTPQFGGLTSRELLGLLRGIFDLPVIGFDVVEVAPNLDPSLASVFAARKIITECWGHHFRKSGLLDRYNKNVANFEGVDWVEWDNSDA